MTMISSLGNGLLQKCREKLHTKGHGLPDEFFQFFWHLIGNDLLKLFHDFYDGKTDVSRLNYRVVTLLAKGQGLIKSKCFIRFVC